MKTDCSPKHPNFWILNSLICWCPDCGSIRACGYTNEKRKYRRWIRPEGKVKTHLYVNGLLDDLKVIK